METNSPEIKKDNNSKFSVSEIDIKEEISLNTNAFDNYNTYPSNFRKEMITNGDFNCDPYSFSQEVKDATDEHLIFVVHGIGQNERKLKSTLQKIKNNILTIYSKKSSLFTKQFHVRVIDWKTTLLEKEHKTFNDLVDLNNETKYPKMFIQQVPLDVLHYLSHRNKYTIVNDVIFQMNSYYELVKKYRPLFNGNVSIVGHSIGSVMIYDILTNMSKNKYQKKKSNNLGNIQYLKPSPKEALCIIKNLDRSKRKDNLKEFLQRKTNEERKTLNENKIIEEIKIDNESESFKMGDHQPAISKNFVIHSLDPKIHPIKFAVEHFFMMGSPLSLFLSVEHGMNYSLQEMEIVKDFHNIIHPMDPVAYRIEPLIMDFPRLNSSFVLPHWENDGINNFMFHHFMKFFFCDKGKVNDEVDEIGRKKIDKKRYDFMVQEYPRERALNVIGFLFSHSAYWNNTDVFYFVIKMIHGQGYQPPKIKPK